MAKSLNLKIKKAKLITALEKSLADQTKKFEANDKNEADYEKAKKAYETAIAKLIKAGKGEVTEVSKCHQYGWERKNSGKLQFSVTYDLPKGLVPAEPERKETVCEREYNRTKQGIENALRMLNISDDEFVNASTVASVSEYL